MIDDFISKDAARFTVDPVVSCREKAETAGIEDKKQVVVDGIMARLEELHREHEPRRASM